jgi:two-component system, NtrC family, response regulator GlrR
VTRHWMLEYDWPGNIRELQNYLYRVFVLSRGPMILVPQVKGDPICLYGDSAAHLIAPADNRASPVSDALQSFNCEKVRMLEQFEHNYLHRVMQETKGNISLAARHAGKERRAFRRLLKKHGIERQRYAN